MNELMVMMYFLVVVYSIICAPSVFFKLFHFRDTAEYTFFYFLGCVLLGVSGLGAVFRIIELANSKAEK